MIIDFRRSISVRVDLARAQRVFRTPAVKLKVIIRWRRKREKEKHTEKKLIIIIKRILFVLVQYLVSITKHNNSNQRLIINNY